MVDHLSRLLFEEKEELIFINDNFLEEQLLVAHVIHTLIDTHCELFGNTRQSLKIGVPKIERVSFQILGISMGCDSSLAAEVAMAPSDSRFDPRQRRHLICAQLVSQLIRVQLVLLD